jgi:hypothetical protein
MRRGIFAVELNDHMDRRALASPRKKSRRVVTGAPGA